MEPESRLIIMTDLDGSLLDYDTYGYEPARSALEDLQARGVPVMFSSSKTFAEVEPLRLEMKNVDPFIVENGGAVYVPEGYFPQVPENSVVRDGYHVIEFGVPYAKLREGLRTIEQKLGIRLKGFGDMSLDDVVATTGLSPIQAMAAQKREYDEPFLVNDPSKMFEIRHEAGQLGLLVVLAGRFAHLVGGTHKGPACRTLLDLFRKHWGSIKIAAIGDSLNDIPMLEQADYPFLVEQRGGGYQSGIAFKQLIRVEGVGPIGWAKCIQQLGEV
ncbi:HAD-IIB family hydrolase [Candidatus Nitronereus thalassa]|uniref:HAD-IIB family hydrolase n=1 Tax=Candidatus Nitronereus thalassa TaxID=3020898 RepID=A0ABU3KBZ4_9BACT|nr:HAD-IIB family hydrolase [Candidatus Nitronereus thalassa]MDT7043906.1 HAD-IIB family hydrolase [Candidatus Nitronereus thalassa]